VTEDKSARYHRRRRRAELGGLAWAALLLGSLLASGAGATLGALAERLTGGHPILSLAIVVLVIALLHEPAALLAAWYQGFVLERRYGLSRQSGAQWAADHARASALALGLALVGAEIAYACLRAWPEWWWLVSAGVFTALLVVFVHLAPVLLLPLFFRLRPLERQALRDKLQSLASRAGTPVVGVFEWVLGDRTSKANAALTGLGPTRRILISDTMLAQYSDDEIEVVLAHELAHHVHHDIWRAIAAEAAILLLGFLAAAYALTWLSPAVGLRGPDDPGGVPLMALALGAAAVISAPLAMAASRHHERRADRFALDLTRNPTAFLSAMRKLGGQNLAEERPSRLVEWFFYSHPPLAERLSAARNWSLLPPVSRGAS
jgi:Zn-dependent protease with chaperone function